MTRLFRHDLQKRVLNENPRASRGAPAMGAACGLTAGTEARVRDQPPSRSTASSWPGCLEAPSAPPISAARCPVRWHPGPACADDDLALLRRFSTCAFSSVSNSPRHSVERREFTVAEYARRRAPSSRAPRPLRPARGQADGQLRSSARSTFAGASRRAQDRAPDAPLRHLRHLVEHVPVET
jgi:hypothetical protein